MMRSYLWFVKRERFKKRDEGKKKKGKRTVEEREHVDEPGLCSGPAEGVGPSGVSGPAEGGGINESGPGVSGAASGPEELVEEIRREMRRRATPLPAAGEQEDSELSCDSESEGSYLTTSCDSGAEEGRKVPFRRPRFKRGEQLPYFSLCMVFPNKSEFKKAVERYAIEDRRDLRVICNERTRCRVVCGISDCPWKILCSIDGRSAKWMVKTYVSVHTCQKQFHISCLTFKSIAEWFIHHLKKLSLKLTIAEMRDHFIGQTKVKVSRGQCKYARQKIIEHYIGDPLKEFARLEDYVEELKRSNPGSTIVLDTVDGVFSRMYVCFDGVRKGFNVGCRKIIGLDGCFLKGPFKGEILAAVGRDANDQIYPISWAVVSYECKDTWKWFLELLMLDLDVAGGNFVYAADGAPSVARGEGFTFMSDQQKGLLSAINELMPSAVSRRCARHIFAKWRREHKSEELHRQFWATCKASTPSDFLDELEVLGGMSNTAMSAFLEIPPVHWCKAFQNASCCSDIVDNNMSETFNSMIIESRYKSIVKLFETIRKVVFKRFKERRLFLSKFKDGFGPRIWKKINHNIEKSGNFYVDSNGDDGYEVHLDEDTSWVVSLEKSTCTCRMWDLTGIPCPHAMSVISSEGRNLDVSSFVSKWYSREMFELAYEFPIKPVQCKKYWPRVSVTPIKPPSFVKFPGRPKKLRRREGWEPAACGTKMSQKGRKMACSVCKQYGHTAKKCSVSTVNQVGGEVDPPVVAAESVPIPAEIEPLSAQTEENPAVIVEPLEEPTIKRRKIKCSYCHIEGHRRNICVSNPSSKRYISLSTTQTTQASQVLDSQVQPTQVRASQENDRTGRLLQELRESCGTARHTVGRKKKIAKKKGKLPAGYGLFVADSGWTCVNPNTPQERVISVPSKTKPQLLGSQWVQYDGSGSSRR